MKTELEHANITVADPEATARWMAEVFGWHIRWQGAAKNNGFTIHIGSAQSYLALYSPKVATAKAESSYVTTGGLNHLAMTVDDIDEMEKRVKAAGFITGNHADYEPGRRFYFHDDNGIEFEVVQYD